MRSPKPFLPMQIPNVRLRAEPCTNCIRPVFKGLFPRNVESLIPVPENVLSAVAKEQKQMNIRLEAGKRLDLHTKALKELDVADCVQLQNMWGNIQ